MTIPDGVSPGQRFLVQLPSTARPAVAKGAAVDGVAAQGGLAAGSRSHLPDSKPSIQATQQEVLRAQQVEQRQRRHQQELAQCEAAKRDSQQLLQAAQQAAQALEAAQQADHGSRGRQITPGEKLRLVLATSAVLVHAATCKNALYPPTTCHKKPETRDARERESRDHGSHVASATSHPSSHVTQISGPHGHARARLGRALTGHGAWSTKKLEYSSV